jgi:SAM-dependent methyltransferase
VLTRLLARLAGVASIVGVDTGRTLIERARALAAEIPHASFQVGDAAALPFPDGSFDAVVFDSVLTHAADPERALDEAVRVLRPGGRLGVFDGDYATTTVAIGEHDPLQACVAAMMAASVRDPYLVRRLARLLEGRGLRVDTFRSHGYVEAPHATYLLTVIDRGADMLAAAGRVDPATAAALQAEARRRSAGGTFFGHIAYAGVVARAA